MEINNIQYSKSATLFGGAMNDTTTQEYLDTVEIGSILVKNGYIVKSGGYRGMMEAVSKGAADVGGVIIGYTCKSFGSVIGNQYLTYNYPQDDLYDRLRKLIEDTSLFIVQKGGIGTLTELLLSLDIVRKMKKEKRPQVILIGEFWHTIMEPMKQLMHPKEHDIFKIVNNLEEFKQIKI